MAAKCTINVYESDLLYEGLVYKQLESVQGTHIPVCLGNIDLDRVYSYDCGIQITHMMFMAWVGQRIDCQSPPSNLQLVTKQAIDAIHAIHELGVLHLDVMPRNLLWNEELQRVMFIDFERSEIMTPLPKSHKHPLMPISPNHKRKLAPETNDTLTINGKWQGQDLFGKSKFQIFAEKNGAYETHKGKFNTRISAEAFSIEVEGLKRELKNSKISLKRPGNGVDWFC